jgi:hypothetical protein
MYLIQVQIWMKKEDNFPNFGGRIDVKGLDFHISDAPASFTVCVLYPFGLVYFQVSKLQRCIGFSN